MSHPGRLPLVGVSLWALQYSVDAIWPDGMLWGSGRGGGGGQVGGVCPKPEWGRIVGQIFFFTVVFTERVLKSKYFVNSLKRSEHRACTPGLR